MAKCAYCSTTIVFGGVRDGDARFCNDKCQQSYRLINVAVPPELLREQLTTVHQGLCPKCGGSGPVDVYYSYKVWSILVLTSWSASPQICCRSCATQRQAGSLAFCLFLGWWGFPWGLVLTPIQVVRNIVGMCRTPDPLHPSPELEKFVRVTLAANLVRQQNVETPALAANF